VSSEIASIHSLQRVAYTTVSELLMLSLPGIVRPCTIRTIPWSLANYNYCQWRH